MTVRLLTNIGRLWTGHEIFGNAAILVHNDRIAWVGRAADLPQSVPGVVDDIVDVDHVENLGGALVTPGLIDAHTHPVYAGNRYAELAMRSGGSSAAAIAAAGGGINSTITVTRGTDPWTLCNGVRERLRDWLLSGTTTVEAKTGFHLTRDGELASVRLLRDLEKDPMMPRVHVTFLAAHVVPPEYFGRQHDYVEAVAGWCTDAAAAGADSVDVYCHDGHFTPEDARWILAAGRNVGLTPRLHVGGTAVPRALQVAAEMQCAADLIHKVTDEDIEMMSRYGIPAVVCPATALQSGHLPPVRRMIAKGIPVALGSDHNPGHCGITSMSLVISLAVAAFGMSVGDALRAATLHAAQVLKLEDRGILAPNRLADIVQWDADHEGAFAWSFGLKPRRVWRGGVPVQ